MRGKTPRGVIYDLGLGNYLHVTEARCGLPDFSYSNVNVDENKEQLKKIEVYISNEVEIKEKRQRQN